MMAHKYILILFFCALLTGCLGYYKIPKNSNGERLVNERVNYTFTRIPSKEDRTKIDTSAHYIQIFEGREYNESQKKHPATLIFHDDGSFQEFIIEPYVVNKDSIYYGGKYQITGDLIELEQFYPSRGGETNYYSRHIRQGQLVNDQIIFDDGFTLLTIFEKGVGDK